MKNPSTASINDPVNVDVLDDVLKVYILGSALKPGRSSMGMVSLFPLSQLTSLHVCTYIKEKGYIPTHLWC